MISFFEDGKVYNVKFAYPAGAFEDGAANYGTAAGALIGTSQSADSNACPIVATLPHFIK